MATHPGVSVRADATSLAPAWAPVYLLGLTFLAAVVFMAAPRDGWLQIGAFFVPLVAAVGAMSWRRIGAHGDLARVTTLLLLGQLLNLAANLVWYLLPVVFDRDLPYPSLNDPVYFVSYGLIAWAIVRMLPTRHEDPVAARVAITDAAILTLSLSSFMWVAQIRPNLEGRPSLLTVVVTLGYPAFNLVLLALVARLWLTRRYVRRDPLALLVLWLAMQVIGDVAYGVASANGTFRHDSPFTAAWSIAYGALGAVALHPGFPELVGARRTPIEPAVEADATRVRDRFRLFVLLAAALLPLLLAVLDRSQVVVLMVAAALTFSLVIHRVAVVAGDAAEQRRLSDQLREMSDELRHRAFHDPLTALGNRALCWERLDRALARPSHDDRLTATVLLDLDDFKAVNDTLGHDVGDQVLVHVSRRLVSSLRPSDTVVRLGGDEFAAVLEEVSPDDAVRVASQIVDVLDRPLQLGSVNVRTRASVGLHLATAGATPREAMHGADLAMYAAKRRGGGRVEVFEPELHRAAMARVQLEQDLECALDEGQFRLVYQPIVRVEDQTITGVEGLVRWQHPDRGLLMPSAFIDAAESTDLIVRLGGWVLREACHQVQRWKAEAAIPSRFTMSVNLSRRQLLEPGVVDELAGTVAECGIAPSTVAFEVTESVIMADVDQLSERLHALGERGFTIAMDDFGTGHSSLAQLRDLPVDVVKIDRAFVQRLDGGADDVAVTGTIVDLAHGMGKRTVAEGVETPSQFERLRSLRADLAQGYLLGRPADPAVIAATWFTGGNGPGERAEV